MNSLNLPNLSSKFRSQKPQDAKNKNYADGCRETLDFFGKRMVKLADQDAFSSFVKD
jgi:hypothetical protein